MQRSPLATETAPPVNVFSSPILKIQKIGKGNPKKFKFWKKNIPIFCFGWPHCSARMCSLAVVHEYMHLQLPLIEVSSCHSSLRGMHLTSCKSVVDCQLPASTANSLFCMGEMPLLKPFLETHLGTWPRGRTTPLQHLSQASSSCCKLHSLFSPQRWATPFLLFSTIRRSGKNLGNLVRDVGHGKNMEGPNPQ